MKKKKLLITILSILLLLVLSLCTVGNIFFNPKCKYEIGLGLWLSGATMISPGVFHIPLDLGKVNYKELAEALFIPKEAAASWQDVMTYISNTMGGNAKFMSDAIDLDVGEQFGNEWCGPWNMPNWLKRVGEVVTSPKWADGTERFGANIDLASIGRILLICVIASIPILIVLALRIRKRQLAKAT